MKKRILALLLATIMCLSCMALFACQKEKPVEEKPFYDYVAPLAEKEQAVKLQKTIVLADNEVMRYDDGKFFVTTEKVYNEFTNEYSSTVYRLYSFKAGKIAEQTIRPYDKSLSTEQPYGLNVYYADGYAFVAKTYGEYDEEYSLEWNEELGDYVYEGKYIEDPYNSEVTVYDEYGNKLLEFEPEFAVYADNSYNYNFDYVFSLFTFCGMNCAYYDEKLFEITEKGETKLIKDFADSAFDFNNMRNEGTFTDAGDYYIYRNYYTSSRVYTYFDKSFNYVNTFTYFYTHNEEIEGFVIFPNGNIFINKLENLGKNSKDYDVKYLNEYTGEYNYYACKYELYNASTGEISSVEAPDGYVISNVSVNHEFDSEKAIAYVVAYAVIDGNVSNEPKYFFMDNDGKFVVEIKIPHDAIDFYRLSDDRVVVELPYVSYLYKNDGTKVGAIDTSYDYLTSSYIVYEDKILNMNLETVFEIPEDYEFEEIYADFDTIFFVKEELDENGDEYDVLIKWNGTSTVIDGDDFYFMDMVYYIEKEKIVVDENGNEDDEYTVTLYSLDGTELFTISSEDDADYDYDYIDDVFIFYSEVEDESTGDVTITIKSYFAN